MQWFVCLETWDLRTPPKPPPRVTRDLSNVPKVNKEPTMAPFGWRPLGDSQQVLQTPKGVSWGRKGYLLAMDCYGVSKMVSKCISSVSCGKFWKDHTKLGRFCPIFTMSFWIGPCRWGNPWIESSNFRIRLAQWRARVLLLGLPVMLWCGFFFHVVSMFEAGWNLGWNPIMMPVGKNTAEKIQRIRENSPPNNDLLFHSDWICFQLDRFWKLQLSAFSIHFDLTAWWTDMCRKKKDIRPGWVKSDKIAKLRARTIS